MEQVISATTLTEHQLALLEKMFGQAERPQALARTLATERAMGIAMFGDRSAQAAVFPGARRLPAAAFLGLLKATGLLQRDKAFYLDAMAADIAVAELPLPERCQVSQPVGKLGPIPTNRLYIISRLMLPDLKRSFLRDADHAARIRAALAVLAVERFRRAHDNALPAGLGALTPTWLSSVPADPYDGQPLRFQKRGSGCVAYSIGSDGHDDGGTEMDAKTPNRPHDITFIVEH
jgi:hypothetical protein